MNTTILLASAILTMALDQGSKLLVTRRLAVGQQYMIAGDIGLRRVTNFRAGMLPLSQRLAALVWLAVTVSLVLGVGLYGPLRSSGAIGLGLVLGGASSNLADRLARGGVVDFITVWRWPTFNLADAALAVGAVLAVGGLL